MTTDLNSLKFDDKEFIKVMHSVNQDYHDAFKEYLLNLNNEFRPHNPAFMIVGTLLLWVCWLFFNAGSVEELEEDLNRKIGRIMMCNVIGPSFSGLFAVLFKPRITGEYNRVNKFDIGTFCNGIIVGLVAVTASCDDI